MSLRILIVISLLALAACAEAQCDSTPPQLHAAFTLYGAKQGDNFGWMMYVIHDSNNRAQLAIASGNDGMRVYSRYAGQADTSYRCCLPYSEAHECHVTGSSYADIVVMGESYNIYLIPGSPEGIWSQRRWLLMPAAYDAKIAVGRFRGGDRDDIVIGNENARSVIGSVSIWYGRDSLTETPDTVLWGDTASAVTEGFGFLVGAIDLNGDTISDLIVQSGPSGSYPNHEMNIFWGGAGFPSTRTRWRDNRAAGWYYDNGAPFGFADVTRDHKSDLHILTSMQHDTVWGNITSGSRSFVYRDWAPFDTTVYLRWRPLDGHANVCIPNISGFGWPVVDIGDVNGDSEPDIAVGAYGSFNGDGAVVLYLGGSKFDTLPDAYFSGSSVFSSSPVGAGGVVGGFDWNGDGLMDFAVPLPSVPTPIGSTDHPCGEVVIVSGSRALRSIGVNGVNDRGELYPSIVALQVTPHPVRDLAYVTVVLPRGETLREDARILIYDLVGRAIASAPARDIVRGSRAVIDLTGFPPGLYSAVVRNNGNLFAKTFIHVQ